MEMLNL